MTVQQLLENANSTEITEWIAFINLESRAMEMEKKRQESAQNVNSRGHDKFSIFDLPESDD